jgi:hypothetical protein
MLKCVVRLVNSFLSSRIVLRFLMNHTVGELKWPWLYLIYEAHGLLRTMADLEFVTFFFVAQSDSGA